MADYKLSTFAVVVTLCALSPVHALLVGLFNHCSEKARDTGYDAVVQSINSSATSCVDKLDSHPSDGAEWLLVRMAGAGVDDAIAKSLRAEEVRVLTNLFFRLALRASEPPFQFMRAVGMVLDPASPQLDEQRSIAKAADDLFNLRPCCRSLPCRRLIDFLGSPASAASPEKLQALHGPSRAWRGSLLHAERKRAGGKRRTNKLHGKPRSWSRQVSQYIVSEAANAFEQDRGITMKSRTARTNWNSFRLRMTKKRRAGLGGNGKMVYLNEKLHQLRRQNLKRGEIHKRMRALASQYDEDNELQLQYRLKHRRLHRDRVALRKQRQRSRKGKHGKMAEALPVDTRPWGVASDSHPISKEFLEKHMQSMQKDYQIKGGQRGGLRRIAEYCLQESDFIIPPKCKTLKHPEEAPCCLKHPGFCRGVAQEAAVGVEEKYKAIVSNLHQHTTVGHEARTLFRVRSTPCDGDGQPWHVYFFMGKWHGRPQIRVLLKCKLVEGQGGGEAPFVVAMQIEEAPLIQPHSILQRTVGMQTSLSLAYELAEASEARGCSFALDLLEHSVGETLAQMRVTAVKTICPNMLEATSRQATAKKRKGIDEDLLSAMSSSKPKSSKKGPMKGPAAECRSSKPSDPLNVLDALARSGSSWWAAASPKRARAKTSAKQTNRKNKMSDADSVDDDPAKVPNYNFEDDAFSEEVGPQLTLSLCLRGDAARLCLIYRQAIGNLIRCPPHT